jgi:hypothetical protein
MNQVSNDSTKQRVFTALRRAGRGLTAAAGWLGDRIDDLAQWIANLIRLLPVRVGRIGLTLGFAAVGLAMFFPIGLRVWRWGGPSNFSAWLRARARRGGIRAVQFVLQVLDLFGVPELFAFLWRAVTRATPLTGDEIVAATSVLGPFALRFQDIRVAQGGVLRLIFRRNGDRAFATFHTVNLPATGYHERSNVAILVHELVHVYQYERAGSRYFAEALLAQHEAGYDYGGAEALRLACRQGKRLRDFNREQQAQIVQDCYVQRCRGGDTTAFEPFIAELRAGRV